MCDLCCLCSTLQSEVCKCSCLVLRNMGSRLKMKHFRMSPLFILFHKLKTYSFIMLSLHEKKKIADIVKTSFAWWNHFVHWYTARTSLHYFIFPVVLLLEGSGEAEQNCLLDGCPSSRRLPNVQLVSWWVTQEIRLLVQISNFVCQSFIVHFFEWVLKYFCSIIDNSFFKTRRILKDLGE